MRTLTVRENIAFSAALRLPSVYSRRDRRQKVNLVIKQLRLTAVADTKVNVYQLYNLFSPNKSQSCRTNILVDTSRLVQLRAFLKQKENSPTLEWS